MRRKNKTKKSEMALIFILLFGLTAYAINEIDVDIGQQVNQTTETTTTEEDNVLFLEVKTLIEKSNVYIKTNYQNGYEYGSGVVIHEDNDYYYAITRVL